MPVSSRAMPGETFAQPTALSGLRLAIACPLANEAVTIQAFVRELLRECDPLGAVAFVGVFDRVCRDATPRLLGELAAADQRIRVVWEPEGSCPTDAYVRGYREALATGYEWILDINAGYRHQPGDLKQFFPCMLAGYDCVFGSRFLPGGELNVPSRQRRLLSRGGTTVANALLGTRWTDMTSGYQCFRREALSAVLARGLHSRFHFLQTEMKAYCRHLRVQEVPIRYANEGKALGPRVLADAARQLLRMSAQRLRGAY